MPPSSTPREPDALAPDSHQHNAVALRRIVDLLTKNYQEEKEGAATYRTLGERETDERKRKVLMGLAEAEEKHAERWAARIIALGEKPPVYRGKATGTADSLVNRISGTEGALRRIELEERRHTQEYGRQLKELGDAPSVQILQDLMADEKAHARALRRLYRPGVAERPLDPQAALDRLLARRSKGRVKAASWIGDAIYGVNDGLGAIFGIVSGVSGATAGESKTVLIAGLAGMIASALSMGSGAYLAAKSEREIYEAELHHERIALQEDPDEGKQMLSLFYQIKGVPVDDADRVAGHLAVAGEDTLLKAVAAERLNASEESLSNPIVSALSGMLSTAVGAFIPIIPFFFMKGIPAIIAAAVISLVAHFAVGAAKSLITVRSWWASGAEMTLIGAVEGLVTYGIGLGLGHIGGGGLG